MRIVFFASPNYTDDVLFQYLHSRITSEFPDSSVVVAEPTAASTSPLRRQLTKVRRLGLLNTLEILTGLPIARHIFAREERKFREILRSRMQPRADISVIRVTEVNSREAQDAIARLAPDILIQAGAGLLRENIFSLPTIGTINLHHGIAPSLRGMNSTYWAKWEKRYDWLGATVHFIDAGIDTGRPIYYAEAEKFRNMAAGEINARTTIMATDGMINFLKTIERNEPYRYPEPKPDGVYRSTISGWKLLITELRSRKRSIDDP